MCVCLCARSLQVSVLQAYQSKRNWMCICGLELAGTLATCWITCLQDSLQLQGALMPTALPHTCTAKVRLKLTFAVSIYLVLSIVLLQCTGFPFLLITT